MRVQDVQWRGGIGMLLLWAVANITIAIGAQMLQMRIFHDAAFEQICYPFIVLPALLLGAYGSIGAMYLAVVFFALYIVESFPFSLGPLLFRVMLLVVAVQSPQALRRMRSQPASVSEDSSLATAAIPLRYRISLVMVIVALLLGALGPVSSVYYFRDNYNIPIPLLMLALVGIGVLWTIGTINVARQAWRHPVLIWIAPVLTVLLGLLILIVVCPSCMWGSDEPVGKFGRRSNPLFLHNLLVQINLGIYFGSRILDF